MTCQEDMILSAFSPPAVLRDHVILGNEPGPLTRHVL